MDLNSENVPIYDGPWSVQAPQHYPGQAGDLALRLDGQGHAHRYGLSHWLTRSLQPANQLVLQYEVKAESPWLCGGAYLKLMGKGFQPSELTPETPYSLLFGPDRCGVHVEQVLFMLRLSDGQLLRLKNPPRPRNTRLTTLYTLILEQPDTPNVISHDAPDAARFEIQINGDLVREGSLTGEFFEEAGNDQPLEISVSLDQLMEMTALSIEVFSVEGGLCFDNILLTTDRTVAQEMASQTFLPKQEAERAAVEAEAMQHSTIYEEVVADKEELTWQDRFLLHYNNLMCIVRSQEGWAKAAQRFPWTLMFLMLMSVAIVWVLAKIAEWGLANNRDPAANRRKAFKESASSGELMILQSAPLNPSESLVMSMNDASASQVSISQLGMSQLLLSELSEQSANEL